jgi:parallel beta-helix repeat protein
LIRATLATFMLLMLTTDFAFGQTTTLCQELDKPPTATDIDVVNNTNTMPTDPIQGVPPPPFTKQADGRTVQISGKITITNPVVIFNNCKIRMFKKVDEEAGFIVPSGTTLIFKGCRIAAGDCQKLWDKIDVQGGTLQMEGNTVEDAKTVVYSNTGGSRITVKDNTFNRNYTGIYLNSLLGQKASIYDIGFNTIKQEGLSAIPFYQMQRGINIANIKGIKLTGKFENLHNGITMANSVANINGADFTKMMFFNGVKNRDDFAAFGFPEGNGIQSSGNSICNISSCNFDNCEFAGFASNSVNLKCQNSFFKNVKQFGILTSLLVAGGKCLIDNNDFECENAAETSSFIDIESRVAGFTNIIKNNDFNLKGNNLCSDRYACIYYNGRGVNSMQIINNTFNGLLPFKDGKGFAAAIWALGGIDSKISNNTINLSRLGSKTRGIIVADGNEYCAVEDNILSSGLEKGIELLNSKFTLLCSNTINNSQQGIVISGDCEASDIYNSAISNNTVASIAVTDNNSGINFQRHYGNRFLAGSGGAFHDGADYHDSDFWVNNKVGTSCAKSEYMPSSVSPSDWFNPKTGCTTACAFASLVSTGGDDEITVLDKDIMANALVNKYGYTMAEVWNANFNLYKRIIANPALNNNSDINAYFNIMSNSNFAQFYNVANVIKSALNDENYNEQVNTLIAQRDLALKNALTVLPQCINNEDNIELENAYNQAIIQYNAAMATLDTYIQNHNANRNTTLETASSLNEGIETNSAIEVNLQTINRLQIKYFKDTELADSEWNTVEQIAQICTKNGGFPTKIARELVGRKGNINENSCSKTSGKVKATNKSNNNATFYPNPASNELNINYKVNTINSNEVEIKIYDLSGRLVVYKSLNLNQSNTLDISELKEGFYLINLYEENRLVKANKFVKSY